MKGALAKLWCTIADIVMLRTEIEMTHVNNTAVQSSQYEHIIIFIQYSSAVYVGMVVVVCIP